MTDLGPMTGFGESESGVQSDEREPWPLVDTYGELDAAEWLHTNGAGAYAMSTVPMMHTRRYHGILVAPLRPPLGRFVVLSHVELTLHAQGRHYRLSTHQFPNLAPTPGYRLLRRFAMDPIPHWTYRIGDAEFERNLCLIRGQNVAVMTFTWHGKEPATLLLRPLLPLRSIHRLMHEHGAMVQRVTLRQREVEIQPMVDLPPVCFRHSGVFVGSPDWWRRFEYLEDRNRAAEFQEDLWTPGTFEIALTPDAPQYLVTAVGELPTESARDLVKDTIDEIRAFDPGPRRPRIIRTLTIAAEAYRVQSPRRASIIAGYPWYGIHLRDALMALPGLCLVTGEIEFAQRMLSSAIDTQRGGLLPEVFTEAENRRGRPSPDSTLWLFEAARTFMKHVPPTAPFVKGPLFRALRRAFVRLRSPRYAGKLVWTTAEGLIANHSDDRALTWMDAQVGSWIVTPRRGLAIEMQALWSKGCETLSQLAAQLGDTALAEAARAQCVRARASFRRRFWCTQTDYPFDCVSEERDIEGAWGDPSVRPNALMALAIDPELFEDWQAAAIVVRVRQDLLTPRGIRTLAPNDPRFQGYHEGGLEEREGSAHQGTVWPHLIGSFVRAAVRLEPDDETLRRDLRHVVEQCLEDSPALCHISQMADGDAPHRARACPAQAWAVGELLRALVEDLAY